MWTVRQVDAVRGLAVEENNLADCLRDALAVPDPWSVVRLLSALGSFWTVRGENTRVIALAAATDTALEGWLPTAEQVDAAVSGAPRCVRGVEPGHHLGRRLEGPDPDGHRLGSGPRRSGRQHAH